MVRHTLSRINSLHLSDNVVNAQPFRISSPADSLINVVLLEFVIILIRS